MINILAVDDHTLFRKALKHLLQDDRHVRVLDEAGSGDEALVKLRQQRFDLVLLDINLPDSSGLNVLESIRAEHASLPVVILSMYPVQQYALHALRARANYVAKDAEPEDLMAAIRAAMKGRVDVPSSIAERVVDSDLRDGRSLHRSLSRRESEVMTLYLTGLGTTEIAARLRLAVSTVSEYRRRIFIKLGVQSIADLIRYGIRHRID